MKDPIAFALADRDFYAPLERSSAPGTEFRPSRVPGGWRRRRSGIWTQWERGGLDGTEDGWKVHVSARPDRLAQVLDLAAEVLFDEGVTFKHLSAQLFYRWLHHKHGARSQSGKFIAAYPVDVQAARRLMERLREALTDEDGPYVLTDRRFKDSRTVHYRYGAFAYRSRVRADGRATALVRDGNGLLVEDRRGVSFQLPDGVTDPFVPSAAPGGKAAAGSGPVTLGDFAIDSVVRHSNGGGAYRGHHTATGRPVFVKEARAHTGLGDSGATAQEQLRAEWRTLRALHRTAPGLAPEPIAYLRGWEHEFLVTEFIEGSDLRAWMAASTPLIGAEGSAQDIADYYRRCETVISGVERAVARLHDRGYLFVDVSPGNVLVRADDSVRLVDFEGAQLLGAEFARTGTPGFTPPDELIGDDTGVYDEYGLAALALMLLAPFNQMAQRNPDSLAHLHYDLGERAPVAPSLWARATKFHAPGSSPRLPTPEQVADDPAPHLAALRDKAADALLAMADVDDPARVFPTIAEGYLTNTLCVAYGTAGVVHALRRAGRPLPERVLDRLRRDALDTAGDLPPGLYVGLSGIAWVLADCGMPEEALELLSAADRHPLTAENATLFGGAAGVALTHLALYGHTRDEGHVDRALALAAGLPADELLVPGLGPDDSTGLLHGRCGIALMLEQLAGVTGDPGHLARGVRLLHAELDRATDPDCPSLTFPVSETDRRSMPYLFCGSAGLAHAVSRYLRVVDDERLAEALPRLLAPLRTTFTAQPGLYPGLAGMGFALADHAEVTGDASSRHAALRVARGLFKFAVPHSTGVRFLGDQLLRYSADLYSGSAGVLLFLDQLLDPRPDPLFTVDALARQAAGVRA